MHALMDIVQSVTAHGRSCGKETKPRRRPRATVISLFVAEVSADRLVDGYAHREPDAGAYQDVAHAAGTRADLHAAYACTLDLHHPAAGLDRDAALRERRESTHLRS